jgi:hypothetical protein
VTTYLTAALLIVAPLHRRAASEAVATRRNVQAAPQAINDLGPGCRRDKLLTLVREELFD